MKFDKKEWSKNYNKTQNGVLVKLFHHRKEISEKKGWEFKLSYDEFSTWCYENNFEKLFNNWVASNYDKNLKPSVDRIDDYGVYEFEKYATHNLY